MTAMSVTRENAVDLHSVVKIISQKQADPNNNTDHIAA